MVRVMGFPVARLLAGLLAVIWLAFAGTAAAQDSLEGDFFGVGDADGMRLEIRRSGEGFAMTLTDAGGQSQDFTADAVEDKAEAVIELNGRPAYLFFTAAPAGVAVTWTPVEISGEVRVDETIVLGFLREGTAVPELPEVVVAPPSRPGQMIAANAFLSSYEFWDPDGVVRGYEGLPQRFRTLMRLYPMVQLDVIWKLCLAPNGGRAQALALRGQGVSCNEVVQLFAAMQRDGRFSRFKEEMGREKEQLRTTVQCSDGYPLPQSACNEASAELSRRAVALETAATVVRRYR